MNIICITCIHDMEARWCPQFMASMNKCRIPFLNADTEKWDGFYRKLVAYKRAVDMLHGFDCFVFADAYDVMFAKSSFEIVDVFNRLMADIVFSGEKICWPDPTKENLYPKGGTSRFLNAGLWMGRAFHVKKALSELVSHPKLKEVCDQGLLVDFFLNQKSLNIKIDTESRLFQCCNAGEMDNLRNTADGSRVINIETKTEPAAFHGNGGVHLRPIPAWLGLE